MTRIYLVIAIALFSVFMQHAAYGQTLTPQPQCASDAISMVAGPNETATRRAFACAEPSLLRPTVTAETMVLANSQAEQADSVYFVDTAPAMYGGTYVFYVVKYGERTQWWVVTLNSDGKIINVE